MKEIKKFASITPARSFNRFKTAVLLLPFAGTLAGAEGVIDDMSSKATSGMTTIGTTMGTILVGLLAIILGLLAYGIFKKPK